MDDLGNLTELESTVLGAVENEALTLHEQHIEESGFLAEIRTYRNAPLYADQYGVSVDEFRACLVALFPGCDFSASFED